MKQANNKNNGFFVYLDLVTIGFHGNKLLIYCLIKSFTLGPSGFFYGSQKYISDTLGINERTVQRVMGILLEEGYIERTCIEETRGYKTTDKADREMKRAKDLKPEIDNVQPKEHAINELKKETDESDPTSLEDVDVNAESKYHPIQFGKNRLVSMTKKQYQALLALVPAHVLESYISTLDNMHNKAIYTGGYIAKSDYKVMKKWIEEDYSV